MIGYVRGRGLQLSKGYGFIAAENGRDYFFHHSQLVDIGWDETIAERPVEFEVKETPKGPQAVEIRGV